MSLLVGIAILAFAVFVGGLAALWRERGRRAVPAIRTFAVVAAVAIAVFHLLPEAIAAAGWTALIATAIGAFGPAALERMVPSSHGHSHDAPTTALAMGYAAVIAHQAGEGAALASLAGTGALSAAIVLAIAAHTVPLAMVVAIRVLEVRTGPGAKHATFLALAGVALATGAGALGGNLLGTARLTSVQPWILATVAGLLLHALSHDVLEPASMTNRGRVADMLAGWAGLVLALLGTEEGGWIERVPVALRVFGVFALGGAIALRSFWRRGTEAEHEHPH